MTILQEPRLLIGNIITITADDGLRYRITDQTAYRLRCVSRGRGGEQCSAGAGLVGGATAGLARKLRGLQRSNVDRQSASLSKRA